MNRYVVDTHALFWYRVGSSRLGIAAKRAFDEGAAGEAVIFVPSIVLAELYYLNEKFGRPLSFQTELDRLRNAGQFVFVPFEPEHVADFDADSRVPEMHDRMIVGVARRMKATLLTRDSALTSGGSIASAW